MASGPGRLGSRKRRCTICNAGRGEDRSAGLLAQQREEAVLDVDHGWGRYLEMESGQRVGIATRINSINSPDHHPYCVCFLIGINFLQWQRWWPGEIKTKSA